MRFLMTLLGFAAFAITGFAEESRSVSEYDLLMENFRRNVAVKVDAPYEAASTDLKAKYVAALERSLTAYQESGQLEKVLAFKNEIQRIETGAETQTQPGGEVPARLSSLRAVYAGSLRNIAHERSVQLAPLHRKLVAALAELTESLTVAGRLEDAVYVKAKRDEWMEGSSASAGSEPNAEDDPGMSEELFSWLQENELYWPATNANEVVLQFEDDRVLVLADGRQIMKERIEVVSEREFSFSWFGETNTITLERNRKSFTRVMPDGTHDGQVRKKREP